MIGISFTKLMWSDRCDDCFGLFEFTVRQMISDSVGYGSIIYDAVKVCRDDLPNSG